jgi:hypothetical protein
MSALVTYVSLFDEKGNLHSFGPGDSVPSWARTKITNPDVWDAPVDAAEDGDHAQAPEASPAAEPPPQGGPGASRKVWADWAALHKVAVEDGWKRDDIIAACKKAGVPV